MTELKTKRRRTRKGTQKHMRGGKKDCYNNYVCNSFFNMGKPHVRSFSDQMTCGYCRCTCSSMWINAANWINPF